MLLVNSHSFTSLMFPCSNLLGFSSFWLHCTGTRFWNQEKKKSMDMQSVSHSPEGHRLPCHFSKLTPEHVPRRAGSPHSGTDSEQPRHPWAAGPTRTGAPGGWAGHSCKPHRTALKENGCYCPLHAVPTCHRGAVSQEEMVLHNHSAMPVNTPAVWAPRRSLENKSLQCTLSHRNTAYAKRHKC